MSKCQLEVGPNFQCCCNCKHHIRIAEERDHTKTIGYACVLPLENDNFIYGNWGEHSVGCECYNPQGSHK